MYTLLDDLEFQAIYWTMADANGRCVLMSEWHFVNRLHYVITEVPYDPVGQIEVMDLD